MTQLTKGFPGLTLQKAINVMENAMKSGQKWSKDEFATFGTKTNTKGSANSGAFLVRLTALRNYGLITSTKDTISATELASKIISPIDDNERNEAIKDAFLRPVSFNQTVENARLKPDISKNEITNFAVYKLGIPRKRKEKFIKNFIESGKYAGIIKDIDGDNFKIQPVASQSYTEQATSVELEQENISSTVQETPLETGTQEQLKGQLTIDATEASVYGAEHKGQNWKLNLQVLVNLRVPADLRTNIRDLVANADKIADMLYALEEKGGYNVI